MATVTAAVALVAFTAAPTHAQVAPSVVNVPSQQPTIQAGIDAVAAGGSVVVAPGVYRENVDFKGKPVEVRSSAGAASTVIDGGAVEAPVRFVSGELRGSIIRGFTLRNGAVHGGVWVVASGPVITGNVITGNAGAGVDMLLNGTPGPPLVQGNAIQGNTGVGVSAGGFGAPELAENVIEHNGAGGVTVNGGGNAVVRTNLIRYNTGTGLLMINRGDQLVVGNVIAWNSAEVDFTVPSGSRGPYLVNNTVVGFGGAALAATNNFGAPALYNNVFYSEHAAAVVCNSAPPTMASNLLFSQVADHTSCTGVAGVNGNNVANPVLMNPGDGDFRIAGISPGVDAGSNLAPSLPAVDADGAPRVVDGNGDGVAVVDIGAYETTIGPGLRPESSPAGGSQPYPTQLTFDLTLYSSGLVPVHIGGISISGAGFSIASSGCEGAYATLPSTSFCVVRMVFTPPAPGTYNGTLTIVNDGRGGVTHVPLVALIGPPLPSSYVNRAYLDALNRDPTFSEYSFWDNQLAAGLPRDAFAIALTSTPEFRRRVLETFITRLFHRLPNPFDQVDAMVALTQPGLYPIELMEAAMLSSNEFYNPQAVNDQYGPPADANVRYVKALYSVVLGSTVANGDPGLDFWVNRLATGQSSRLGVALGFLYSRPAEAAYVWFLYLTLLIRNPDQAGNEFWINQLQAGLRSDYVFGFFLGSAEYYNRVSS